MALAVERIEARSALNPTGGFLGATNGEPGYTHTFNPAVGCEFAPGYCGAFCYAREFAERLGGKGTWGARVLVKANAPELLERELERASRRPEDHAHHVTKLSVFSASTTDPCAPRLIELYRACLIVVACYPIRRWVVQTRAPGVALLERELTALGERATLSFTLETDDPAAWRIGPPGAPGIAARRRAFEALRSLPIRRHLAVSPCLPLRDPSAFADWIAEHATDATVDTFTCGDGQSGRRTARSELPALLEACGVDWRDETHARELFTLLRRRMGERAGWSAEGFGRLAR